MYIGIGENKWVLILISEFNQKLKHIKQPCIVKTLFLKDNTSSNFKFTFFLHVCWADEAQSKDLRFIIRDMIAFRPKLLIIEPKVDSDSRGSQFQPTKQRKLSYEY